MQCVSASRWQHGADCSSKTSKTKNSPNLYKAWLNGKYVLHVSSKGGFLKYNVLLKFITTLSTVMTKYLQEGHDVPKVLSSNLNLNKAIVNV